MLTGKGTRRPRDARVRKRVRGAQERSDEVLQLGITEVLHRGGVFLPCPGKAEDAVVHITGDEAELFGCIVNVFVLICGRYSDTVIHLVAILVLVRPHHLLPLLLCLENLRHSV